MSIPTHSAAAGSARIPEQAETATPSLLLVACPECGQPAEITDSFTLFSTSGPVLHLRTACVARHHFMLPAERMAPTTSPSCTG